LTRKIKFVCLSRKITGEVTHKTVEELLHYLTENPSYQIFEHDDSIVSPTTISGNLLENPLTMMKNEKLWEWLTTDNRIKSTTVISLGRSLSGKQTAAKTLYIYFKEIKYMLDVIGMHVDRNGLAGVAQIMGPGAKIWVTIIPCYINTFVSALIHYENEEVKCAVEASNGNYGVSLNWLENHHVKYTLVSKFESEHRFRVDI
jgi:hypothetical protein